MTTAIKAKKNKKVLGGRTTATGPDPNVVFEFRYRLVRLDELIASHNPQLERNPRFPSELQPRLRDRSASLSQVRTIASRLNPDAYLSDTGSLDRGPMIVGPDNMVESGNGRTIALRLAHLEFPERWRAYQDALRGRVHSFGFKPADLDGVDDPVLVRERTSDLSKMGMTRAEFAAIGNQAAVMQMSPLEQALADAARIPDTALASLEVNENESIDQALRASRNRPIVDAFLRGLPQNEQAALSDAHGQLNQLALQRVKAALFAKVFPGAAGQRLTQAFFESIDPTVRNVELALFDALPKLARTEGLVRSGKRHAEYAIGEDIARAVDMLARLKQEGMSVPDYIGQSGFFERELSPEAEQLLIFLNEAGRSRKRMRELLKSYADAVIASPHPDQTSMFMEAQETKDELLKKLIAAQQSEAAGGGTGLFGFLFARQKAEAFSSAPAGAGAEAAGQELEGSGSGGAPAPVSEVREVLTSIPVVGRIFKSEPDHPRPESKPKRTRPRREQAEKPPKQGEAITRAQARRRFANEGEGASKPGSRRSTKADIERQARRVAPAKPRDKKGIQLQWRWWRRPSQMDFEDVDEERKSGPS